MNDLKYSTIDASLTSDLVGGIKWALGMGSLVVVRNLKGAMGIRLSAYEFTNLMNQIGRVWTTNDELLAESRFQLKDFPEIIRLQHDGLLGSKKLPLHSDGSHHPARPWPARALLPRKLPTDGSAVTTFYDTYEAVSEVRDWFEDDEARDILCWHQPAYGTGWAGRWNRLIELHPRTGREFVAFDETFIRRIKLASSGYEWDEERLKSTKVELALILRVNAPRYDHHWEPNDLVIWDNRGLVHSRTAVTEGEAREMWRITFDLLW